MDIIFNDFVVHAAYIAFHSHTSYSRETQSMPSSKFKKLECFELQIFAKRFWDVTAFWVYIVETEDLFTFLLGGWRRNVVIFCCKVQISKYDVSTIGLKENFSVKTNKWTLDYILVKIDVQKSTEKLFKLWINKF